jgi:hypothetical protein
MDAGAPTFLVWTPRGLRSASMSSLNLQSEGQSQPVSQSVTGNRHSVGPKIPGTITLNMMTRSHRPLPLLSVSERQ